MLVRAATEADLAGILTIENHEIEHGDSHFGTTPLTLEETRAAFERATGIHPWFVAIEAAEVLGFARCGPWKSREAYRWTTEIGVYVQPDHQSRGIATALYDALFPAMHEAGLRTILAGIALPNEPSVRLHERFGMKHVGTLPSVGFKHDRWIDVGYWAIRLEPKMP